MHELHSPSPFRSYGSPGIAEAFRSLLGCCCTDDAMAKLVEDIAGLKMQWSEKALCQIVRPIDFDIALPGSALQAVRKSMDRDPRAPSNHYHSFVACASRREVIAHPPVGGLYIPLFLNTLDSSLEKQNAISAAVSKALSRSGKLSVDEEVRNRLQAAAAAASVVASLFRMKLGLP